MLAPRSAEEAVASIKNATKEISMPIERLTDPFWDPFSSRHGPGAIHPGAIPAPFRASIVEEPTPKTNQASTKTSGAENTHTNNSSLTPPGLTSTASFSSPDNGVPLTPKHVPTSSVINTSGEKPLKVVPKPARPRPDPAKCLRYPWYDPFMGASCPLGYGEKNKPFPFLDGRPVAEKPPAALFDEISNSLKRGDPCHDISRMVRSIVEERGIDRQGGSRDTPSSTGCASRQVRFEDIPSSAALALEDNEEEARELNPNAGPFGYGINNHIFRIISIHNRINRSDLKNEPVWELDPQTAEPGPKLDFRPLFSMVESEEKMPRPFKDLMYDLRQHLHRYFNAWDEVLRNLHESYDLQAQRAQIRKEREELSVNDGREKRAKNQWKNWRNFVESYAKCREYRVSQGKLMTAAKTLYAFKMNAAEILADPLGAYRNWIEQQKRAAISRAGQSSAPTAVSVSNSVAGAKRVREEDDHGQKNVDSKKMRQSK